MSDNETNKVRDALVKAAPDHVSQILTRDEVVNKWCEENGITKDEIGIAELLKIRALPEWINAE